MVFSCQAAFAQLITGTIEGRVTDPSGAVVGGATVTLVDVATNSTHKAVTDGTGDYRVDLLQVGTYTMSVDASGFKKHVQSNITVNANQDVYLVTVLELGNSTETITVTEEPPQINLENPTVGRTIVFLWSTATPIHF
jgi:hypothetical protein